MINNKSGLYAAYRAIEFSVSLGDIRRSHIVISSEARNLSCSPINDAPLRISPLSFMPPVPYPPLRATFPSRGRLTIRGNLLSRALRASPVFIPRGASIFLCAAPPFLISHFSFLIRAKLSSAIHGRGAHGLTLNLHSPISHTLPCHLSSVERWPTLTTVMPGRWARCP